MPQPQRRIVASTGLLLIAASLGSRIYFEGVGGFIAPFLAPILVFPHGQLFTLVVFWVAVLLIGILAWFKTSRLLAYSFSAGVVLLVVLGEFAAYQLAHGE